MRVLGLAVAAALFAAAPAIAAPDHTFGATSPSEPYAWSAGPGAGLSDAQDALGCVAEINCSFQLFEVTDEGSLTIGTTGDQPTIVDLDIHLLESDADGTEGEEIAAATSFGPSETLATDLVPGFYLMRVDYSGLGTYSGTASWAPLPEEEGL
jgi:hypothetical protein